MRGLLCYAFAKFYSLALIFGDKCCRDLMWQYCSANSCYCSFSWDTLTGSSRNTSFRNTGFRITVELDNPDIHAF